MVQKYEILDGPSRFDILFNKEGDSNVQPPVSFTIQTEVKGIVAKLLAHLTVTGSPKLDEKEKIVFEGIEIPAQKVVRGFYNTDRRKGWVKVYEGVEVERVRYFNYGDAADGMTVPLARFSLGIKAIKFLVVSEVASASFDLNGYHYEVAFYASGERPKTLVDRGKIRDATTNEIVKVVRAVKYFEEGLRFGTLEFPTDELQDGWEARYAAPQIIDAFWACAKGFK